MSHPNERLSTTLTRYLKRHGEAPGEEVSSAVTRVWRRLEPHALPTPARHWLASRSSRPASGGWKVTFAALTAAAIFLLAATPLIREWTTTDPARAVVDSADGSVYRTANGKPATIPVGGSINTGETIRTNGNAGAVLALADGSRVEMRSQSELSLERADDGIRIRLRSGSIIVNAAKQRTGHLYVQTKDMSVSVVGTIFLVNAEKEGSSVAVIEGEVRVRETKGAIETKLRPGEQVSSNRALVTRPVREEIAWSRNVVAHLSILESFTKGMAATAAPLAPIATVVAPAAAASPQNGVAGARPEFEEASIKPCDPDNLPPTPEGARGGGPNSFQMTPGRTHALCMTLATLIRTAYKFGNADRPLTGGGRGRGFAFTNVYGLGVEDGTRVRGGPDWVRTERFTIDAVADDKADPETMRGPMLAALLERRFQLKVRAETEPVDAYALLLASGGLKMKPVDENGCEAVPPGPGPRTPTTTAQPRTAADVRQGAKPYCGVFADRNGHNRILVAGGTTLGGVAQIVGLSLDPRARATVIDRTGNADRFNFILEFDEDTLPVPPSPATTPDAAPTNVPRAQSFATALDALGLKLEPTQLPREYLVIEHAERLLPN